MNQRPNNHHPSRPDPNDPRLRDPRYIAARRAYIARRKKEIRRNRILLGCAAILVLALFIFLVTMIIRGITNAISDDSAETANDSGSVGVTDTVAFGDHGVDTGSVPVGTDIVPAVTETEVTEPPEPVYELSFKAELKDYEKYMNPTGEARDAYLVLVNASNPLTENDAPDDLVDVSGTRRDGRAMQKMRKTAAMALEALFIEAQAQGMMSPDTPSGYPLSVTSAYRDYAYQKSLFSQYTQQQMDQHPEWTQAQAEAKVETFSCRAGTSEHQTGLCCDMHTLTGADVSFKNHAQATWLAENAWKFGFILRFPEDKTEITGISYEPWHFRFVGRYHAYRIYNDGLCLEEYVEALKQE